MGDHLFVEVPETVVDAEHAGDYGRDVSLEWEVVEVVEEEVRRSVLQGRNLNGVKRQESGAHVQVEAQVEYHWHCLPQLWLGDCSTRNRFVWSQKHFEGCLVQRQEGAVDWELLIPREEVREVRGALEVRVPVERAPVVSLYRRKSKVA